MGQYYIAYVQGNGVERVFCPQNAIYMTKNCIDRPEDIKEHSYSEDPNSWGSCFSGMKLMEHSWMENDFVNGVLEAIWDNPCRVAWVGGYADGLHDFDDYYTEKVYKAAWGDDRQEIPFDDVPSIHKDGFIVNCDKGIYIDLEKYAEASTFRPRWDEFEWCIHPLPILTCIGNGRGCGDYSGTNMVRVGSWAMDTILFTKEYPTAFKEVDYGMFSFVEK